MFTRGSSWPRAPGSGALEQPRKSTHGAYPSCQTPGVSALLSGKLHKRTASSDFWVATAALEGQGNGISCLLLPEITTDPSPGAGLPVLPEQMFPHSYVSLETTTNPKAPRLLVSPV